MGPIKQEMADGFEPRTFARTCGLHAACNCSKTPHKLKPAARIGGET